MSIVDDFDAIKADLAKLEQAKAKQPMNVAVEEGSPTDWTDVNLYGYALQGGPPRPEDDLSCWRGQWPMGYDEAMRSYYAIRRTDVSPFRAAYADYCDAQRRYLSPFYQQVLDNGSANRKD